MSHFTVAVFVPEAANQEDAVAQAKTMLRPYQENNMEDCPKEYLEFNDLEDEYREEYETGTTTHAILKADGTFDGWAWDSKYESPLYKEFKRRDPFEIKLDEEIKAMKESGLHRVLPEGARADEEVPYSVVYPTFDAFSTI